MVRVTQPSGGTTQLDTRDDAPTPKAVRVLKPPGGGSSISFGADPEEAPRKASATTGVGAAMGGAEEAKPAEASSPSSPSKKEEESPAAESPKANGNSGSGAVSEVRAETRAVSEVSSSMEKTSISATSTEATSVTSNGSSVSNGDAKPAATEESFPKVSFKESEASKPASDVSTTASEATKAAPEASKAASEAPKTAPDTASNGSHSPDTTQRLFGANNSSNNTNNGRQAVGGKQTPSNHHMRSSIFSGEDYEAPSAAPSNARARGGDTPKAAPAQQPPTRVRQPPGGFSSKLW